MGGACSPAQYAARELSVGTRVSRVALCIDGHRRFTGSHRQLLGREATKQRHLRLLGYEVVQVRSLPLLDTATISKVLISKEEDLFLFGKVCSLITYLNISVLDKRLNGVSNTVQDVTVELVGASCS